jgi:putative ABC transport system permease protein
VARTREDVRAVWSVRWLDQVSNDIRYGVRSLRRSPGFAATAVLTLALGIGANTAAFSVVNAVLIQPLPYPSPEQLMFLSTRVQGFDQFWVSSPEYVELTDISRSFSVIGAFRTGQSNLAALDRPRRVKTAEVNAELFEALAVPPALGRWFRPDETAPNGPAHVILSHALWRSAFAEREDLVGRTIDVNGVVREVVGIMPPAFDLLDYRIDVWLPLQLDRANREEWNRNTHVVYLVGRLNDDVTIPQAQAELAALSANWGTRAGAAGHVFTPGGHVMQMEPLRDEIVGSAARTLWALQAAVGFVLLIACANLASLLLARADTRQRELAVRTAVGASRQRLVAQFTAEGVALSALGCAIALCLAVAAVRVLTLAYGESLPRSGNIAIDRYVVAATLVAAVTTGIVFGLTPMLRSREWFCGRLLVQAAWHAAPMPRPSARRLLVAAEVGFAVILVSGAGLMLRTVANLKGVDIGFDRSRLVTFGLGLPAATYGPFEARRQLYERVMEALELVPGVERVSAMSGLPPRRQVNAVWTDVEGYTPADRPVPIADYYQTVSIGYFETTRTPIVRGRSFQPTDRMGPPVAIVNETFARTFWSGADPLGRRIRSRFGGLNPWLTVVGIAKDVKQGGLDEPTGTEVYFLLDQVPRIFPAWFLGEWGSGGMNIVFRSALPVSDLQSTVMRVVLEADPLLPIIQLRDMDAVVADSMPGPRMLMHLFVGFGALALVLAGIGTYGVLSYVVTQRSREIGIRMALGARREKVLSSVVRQGVTPAFLGIAVGLAAAIALTEGLESLLFGVRPADPVTLAGGAVLLAAVALVASAVPAYRAARVDPIAVLREE